MPEMGVEIKFELEDSDIECDFTPDFRMSANHTDETKISWRLSDSKSTGNVVVLCPEFSDEVSIHPSTTRREDV